MVRLPERPSRQARTPSAVRDSWAPITVVDLTRAVSARSVERSAVRRAGRAAGAEALRLSSGSSEGPEDVQAASPVSAAAVVTQTVVLFMRPPVQVPCSHANPEHSARTWERAPHLERCGAREPAGVSDRGRVLLDEEVAGAVGVERNAGAHRGADGGLPDVATLGGGRLQTEDLLQRRAVVLHQLGVVERRLADDEVQVRVLVDAELDLAALDVVDSLGDIGGDGAGLGVRHETTGTEHAAEAADLAHEVRGGDDGVEVQTALRHLVDELVGADDVGARGTSGLGTVTGREDQDPGGLTGAVREVHGATDHLVGLARVDTQTEGDLDGAVELGRGGLLGETDGLERGVQLLPVDLLVRSAKGLAALAHNCSCVF